MKDKDISFMPELVKKKEAFSRIKDTMFLQNNFLLLADCNFCWTDADKKARLWNEGEFSSLFRVFFFIKHFLQAVEIRQDCCQPFFLFYLFSSLVSSSFSWYLENTGVRKMPGKESRGIEEKKQFFQYGLLPDILYLLIINGWLQNCCLKSIFAVSFLPLFLHDSLKIQGFWAVLLPCSYLLFILSFLPSSTCLFLENTGFLAFFRKKRERKRRMRSRFAGMGFLWIFFVAFFDFLSFENAVFWHFWEKGWEKERKTGSFLLEV